MARTKSSRGVAPFKMRSGNSPLPFWGGVKKLAKKAFNATPIGMAAKALKGDGGDSGSGVANAQAEMLNQQGAVGGLAGEAMGGTGGSDEKLEAINEILNS